MNTNFQAHFCVLLQSFFITFYSQGSLVSRSFSYAAHLFWNHLTFISSMVYHCNSLLYSVSSHVMRKMLAVMNAAARFICSFGPFDHIKSLVRDEVHWLRVLQCIELKIALLASKCLYGARQLYLNGCCSGLKKVYQRHRLRSISQSNLVLPRIRTYGFSPGSFQLSGSRIWN